MKRSGKWGGIFRDGEPNLFREQKNRGKENNPKPTRGEEKSGTRLLKTENDRRRLPENQVLKNIRGKIKAKKNSLGGSGKGVQLNVIVLKVRENPFKGN